MSTESAPPDPYRDTNALFHLHALGWGPHTCLLRDGHGGYTAALYWRNWKTGETRNDILSFDYPLQPCPST